MGLWLPRVSIIYFSIFGTSSLFAAGAMIKMGTLSHPHLVRWQSIFSWEFHNSIPRHGGR